MIADLKTAPPKYPKNCFIFIVAKILLPRVIGDNLLRIIVIAQNSFDLSITNIVFAIYFVIADKLSR